LELPFQFVLLCGASRPGCFSVVNHSSQTNWILKRGYKTILRDFKRTGVRLLPFTLIKP
jgi:hypothetical protein